MATLNGYKYGEELVTKHGWKWAPVLEGVYGDQWVIDPVTGREMSPYEGRELQEKRIEEAEAKTK